MTLRQRQVAPLQPRRTCTCIRLHHRGDVAELQGEKERKKEKKQQLMHVSWNIELLCWNCYNMLASDLFLSKQPGYHPLHGLYISAFKWRKCWLNWLVSKCNKSQWYSFLGLCGSRLSHNERSARVCRGKNRRQPLSMSVSSSANLQLKQQSTRHLISLPPWRVDCSEHTLDVHERCMCVCRHIRIPASCYLLIRSYYTTVLLGVFFPFCADLSRAAHPIPPWSTGPVD